MQWVLGLFPRSKDTGAQVNHSAPPHAKVENEYSCTSILFYSFTETILQTKKITSIP
jgi:hypothetical protein